MCHYLSDNRQRISYDIIIGTLVVIVGAVIAIRLSNYVDQKKDKQEYNDLLLTTVLEAADNIGRVIKIRQSTKEDKVSIYRLSNSLIITTIQNKLFSKFSKTADFIELSTMARRIESCNKMLDILSNPGLNPSERKDNINNLDKHLKRLFDSTSKYINKNENIVDKMYTDLTKEERVHLKDIGVSLFIKKENGKSFKEFVEELNDNNE